MLADKLAFSFCRSGSLGSPYLLWAKSVHLELCRMQVYVRHESGQRQHTTNCTNIESEKHTAKACGTCHHESTPSVDLGGILLHGIVPDNLVQEARTGAGMRRVKIVSHKMELSMLL